MEREKYIHPRQNQAYEKYREGIAFQKDIENVYGEIEFKLKKPDLLGKTVKVTELQFSNVYKMVQNISRFAGIEMPNVYVYEDFYYGAESYGIGECWIEISAKTITDFSSEELAFILAREIYKISDGVTKQKTMMEERFKMISAVAPEELKDVSKLMFNHWYRIASYSADNFAYIYISDFKVATQAILKTVLNSIVLAEQVNVSSFIEQASEINAMDDISSKYTKADEVTPYAPHRIQSLMAYAISARGMNAVIERKRGI